MSKSITAKDADNIDNIRKKAEYSQFIELVGKGEIPDTWELMAEALGIHAQTVTQWKKLPEFREARKKGIEHCLAEMRRAGKEDWRQWEASLKLLGVKGESEQRSVNILIPVFNVMTNESKEQLSKLYEGLDSSND